MNSIAGRLRPGPWRALASAAPGQPPSRAARAVLVLALTGIVSSILVMIWASAESASWMTPSVARPAVGPPWAVAAAHTSARTVVIALWLAALTGGAGVAAGLAAVRRGARVSPRLLLVLAVLAVTALTVLPAVGSTDVLDYAVFGRIVVIGHSPYAMTPYQLRLAHDAYRGSIPWAWQHQVSLYGPLATFEQFVAAKLGGTSVARAIFWLKLWNAVAFGIVAVAADRVLRSDPAARLRAHLLWTINPLLLWGLVAAGHLDVLAAAAGVLGLLALGIGQPTVSSGAVQLPFRPDYGRAALAGVLIGIAADIKAFYVFFGLSAAWSLRKSPRAIAVAGGSALLVLVPTYTWFGPPAIKALLARRGKTTVDNFYQLFFGMHGYLMHHLSLVSGIAVACLAILVLWRLPARVNAPPAVPAALALSVAWLFVWPYQLPWYDAMIVCVLVLYPASWLDWLVLARLTAGTIALMPGTLRRTPTHLLRELAARNAFVTAPAILLAAAVGVIALCAWGRWGLRPVSSAAAGSARPVPQLQRTSPGQ